MKVIEDTAVELSIPSEVASVVLEKISRAEKLHEAGNNTALVVYWGQKEMMEVTRLFDSLHPAPLPQLPSPMLRDYDWPGMFTPFSHQKETAAFLSMRPRAFCFNEAGTGKTSAAIWAVDYLMKLGLVKRVLVVCPLSIMYSAWQGDIFKTTMHRTAAIAHGDKDKRAKVINSDYDFVIINFDGVSVVREEIAAAKFDLIIIDEANAYKTVSTVRWKILSKLITPQTWLWMMTGTPASQSPIDAYGLAKMISPERVPKFATAWRDKVMTQATRFKWVPKSNSRDAVFGALQPAIRFNKAECLDLPALVYQTREVPLTAQVTRYYKALKTQLLIEAAGEQVSAVNAASAMSKLLQISGGAVYTDKKNVVEFDISPRLNALKEVLDETLHKVVVFVPFLHTIEIVTKFLDKQGVNNEVIMGSVSAKNRADIISRFQSDENPRVLVIQPQSASHGVTLTAANTIVFWSPVLSVETYMQCIGRIDRVGQQNKMTVVHLQGSDAERKVYAMLQGKIDSHLRIVDLYKQELNDE
jgi:SNF2 family DNA or RNA helicase